MIRFVYGVSMIGAAALSTGCGGSDAVTRAVAPSLWSLDLNYHAANIALAGPDTVRLHATPRDVSGATLDLDTPVIFSSKSRDITVSSDGLVTANSVTDHALVTVSATSQGITVVDTAIIRVVAVAPTGPLTFSIQPDPPDDGTMSFSFGKLLMVHSEDALVVYFTTSDPTLFTVDPQTQLLNAANLGTGTVYASTWAYGTVLRDSLRVRVTAPVLVIISVNSRTFVDSLTPQLYFSPASITVGVGASVIWTSSRDEAIDVTFDDPSAALQDTLSFFPPTGAGNIAPFPIASDSSPFRTVRSRLFVRKGTFRYSSKKYGTTGEIVVK